MHTRKSRPVQASRNHIGEFFSDSDIELSTPLVYLPSSATPDEHLDVVKRVICRMRGLDISRLTELADGAAAIEAATTLNSHILVHHTTPYVYGEHPNRSGRSQSQGKSIGDAGNVRLHWVEGKSRFLGGWLYNMHVEIACHADKDSSSEHWALTASIQLDDNGTVIDILPSNASAEGGDCFGIRRAHCMCSHLKRTGVIIS